MVVKKAKKLAKTDEMKQFYPTIQDFKFSNKWLDGFIGRHNLSNRKRTTISQQLPEDLIEKQHAFLSFILYRRIQYDYPLNLIANLDKTSLSFDLPSSTTLEVRGSKTISIRSTGHEKNCFTVILACMANGTKLEPVIIFKLKNIPRETFPDGIKIRVNEKGWVNEEEMLWWIENVWCNRDGTNNNPRSLLIFDSFRGHLVNSVKNKLDEKQTNIAVIPGGLTGRLQPLDVGVNKIFKSKVFIYLFIYLFFDFFYLI